MCRSSIVVLLIENNLDDATFIGEMIAESQAAVRQPISILLNHVKTLREARDYLSGVCHCDVVMFDLALSDDEGADTIDRISPYTAAFPTIVLTDRNDVAQAVDALKRGSQDCLVKSEITPAVLSRAIYYAIERFKVVKKEREASIADLQQALSKIKNLNALITICMHCKQIRNHNGQWEQLEAYIRSHFQVRFSHGICPECVKNVYGLEEDDGYKPTAFSPVKTPVLAYGIRSGRGG